MQQYQFPPPTCQVSPLTIPMPLITRVTLEGSRFHFKSVLTLRNVFFTLIQSVSPGTSTHWFWLQHEASSTSLSLYMKVLHILEDNDCSIPKTTWPKLLLFPQQPFIGHDSKFLDHSICCAHMGPSVCSPCGAPNQTWLSAVVWPQHGKTDVTHFLTTDGIWIFRWPKITLIGAGP